MASTLSSQINEHARLDFSRKKKSTLLLTLILFEGIL